MIMKAQEVVYDLGNRHDQNIMFGHIKIEDLGFKCIKTYFDTKYNSRESEYRMEPLFDKYGKPNPIAIRPSISLYDQ